MPYWFDFALFGDMAEQAGVAAEYSALCQGQNKSILLF